jgi:hypothetical protein
VGAAIKHFPRVADQIIDRENRHFIPWNRPQYVEEYQLRELPEACMKLQGSRTVPIGDGLITGS